MGPKQYDFLFGDERAAEFKCRVAFRSSVLYPESTSQRHTECIIKGESAGMQQSMLRGTPYFTRAHVQGGLMCNLSVIKKVRCFVLWVRL